MKNQADFEHTDKLKYQGKQPNMHQLKFSYLSLAWQDSCHQKISCQDLCKNKSYFMVCTDLHAVCTFAACKWKVRLVKKHYHSKYWSRRSGKWYILRMQHFKFWNIFKHIKMVWRGQLNDEESWFDYSHCHPHSKKIDQRRAMRHASWLS